MLRGPNSQRLKYVNAGTRKDKNGNLIYSLDADANGYWLSGFTDGYASTDFYDACLLYTSKDREVYRPHPDGACKAGSRDSNTCRRPHHVAEETTKALHFDLNIG